MLFDFNRVLLYLYCIVNFYVTFRGNEMNIKKEDYEHQGIEMSSYIVDQIKHIEEQALMNDKGKRAAYVSNASKRLVNAELERLGYVPDKDTGLVDEDKARCAFNTYTNIVNRYRNAIKDLGYKHHSLEHSLILLIKKFNHVFPDLSALDNIKQKGDLARYLKPNQKINTLRDKLTILRSVLAKNTEFYNRVAKIKLEHHAYYLFTPIQSVVAETREKSNVSLEEKHANRILINGEWISNKSAELINAGIDELSQWVSLKPQPKDADKYDQYKHRSKRIPYTNLALGLAMACGRRATEIMRTAIFLPGKKAGFVNFSGQLKTKNRRLFEEIKPYDIPLNVDVDLFLKGFELLRAFGRTETVSYINTKGVKVNEKLLSGPIDNNLKNEAVAQKYTNGLNARIRTVLGSGEFSFKDTRAIAAEVAFHNNNPSRLSAKLFLTDYLGHATGKKTSYEYYDGFILDNNIKSIEFLTGSKKTNLDNVKPGETNTKDPKFLAYLKSRSNAIAAHVRAPKWAAMNDWLIDRVESGLNRLDIMEKVNAKNAKTPGATSGTAALRSEFRKNCIIDNKGVAPASVLTFLTDEKGLHLNTDLTWEK